MNIMTEIAAHYGMELNEHFGVRFDTGKECEAYFAEDGFYFKDPDCGLHGMWFDSDIGLRKILTGKAVIIDG